MFGISLMELGLWVLGAVFVAPGLVLAHLHDPGPRIDKMGQGGGKQL